jgi:mono/diheme cytochrome c family protein
MYDSLFSASFQASRRRAKLSKKELCPNSVRHRLFRHCGSRAEGQVVTSSYKEVLMKYSNLIIVLILLGFVLPALAACDDPAAESAMVTSGKALAEKDRCAICHRSGGMAADLVGMSEGKTDVFLQQAITDPKAALGPATRMPAYSYSDEEMQALLHYLRSLK